MKWTVCVAQLCAAPITAAMAALHWQMIDAFSWWGVIVMNTILNSMMNTWLYEGVYIRLSFIDSTQ